MLKEIRGYPIKMENDTNSHSEHGRMNLARKVKLAFMAPGKPVQNAYAESFSDKIRKACFSKSWFPNLSEALRIVEE